MINSFVCFLDFETGSLNPYKCQPLQLAAIMIDLTRMKIVDDSLFSTYIQPELDEEKCRKAGLDPVQDSALQVNKINLDDLAKAPKPRHAWKRFIKYLKNYNLDGQKGDRWCSPIMAGFNIVNFDAIIVREMCARYGPPLDNTGRQTLFNPKCMFDLSMEVQSWFFHTDISSTGSFSMDACREFFGYSMEGAHNAVVDVQQGADLLLRFLKLKKELVVSRKVIFDVRLQK